MAWKRTSSRRVQTRGYEHWLSPNMYGRSPLGYSAMAIRD